MIPVSQAHLNVAAASHPGRKGKNNEDRYAVSAFKLSKERPVPALLAVVADGIGGHRAGEIAAEMAVEGISRLVAASDPLTSGAQPTEILRQAITATSQAIYARAESDPLLHGMGTTCACCWIIDNQLYTAAVGDSRIYLARGKSIHQLTTDHTWIQEAIEVGAVTPDQAKNHPNLHVIRRFLGSQESPQPDLRLLLDDAADPGQAEANQGLQLAPGDKILICTDGLTDLVKREEIFAALENQRGQAAIEQLVALANQRGGYDNITVVLLHALDNSAVRTGDRPRRSPVLLTCLTLSILAILVAGLLGGYWVTNQLGASSERSTAATLTTPLSGATIVAPTQAPGHEPGTPLPTTNPVNDSGAQPLLQTPTGPTANPATLTPWPTNTP